MSNKYFKNLIKQKIESHYDDIMSAYQESSKLTVEQLEEYGTSGHRTFTLKAYIGSKEVINLPLPEYACPICGDQRARFHCEQVSVQMISVDGSGTISGSEEYFISQKTQGPYSCDKCNERFENLEEAEVNINTLRENLYNSINNLNR